MNKSDLVRKIANATDQSQTDVNNFLSTFMNTVKETVAKGDDVSLVGFGKFHSIERAARMGRNPSTGKEMNIPAKTVPKFSAGKEFKAVVAK